MRMQQSCVDNVTLVAVHRLKCHAALILYDLCRHLLGKAHKRLLALCTVALRVNADVHVLVASAIDDVVGQVLDGVEGLGQGADLVYLDENCVCSAQSDTLLDTLGVGDEQVVADDLNLVAEALGHQLPAFPVVLAHAERRYPGVHDHARQRKELEGGTAYVRRGLPRTQEGRSRIRRGR